MTRSTPSSSLLPIRVAWQGLSHGAVGYLGQRHRCDGSVSSVHSPGHVSMSFSRSCLQGAAPDLTLLWAQFPAEPREWHCGMGPFCIRLLPFCEGLVVLGRAGEGHREGSLSEPSSASPLAHAPAHCPAFCCPWAGSFQHLLVCSSWEMQEASVESCLCGMGSHGPVPFPAWVGCLRWCVGVRTCALFPWGCGEEPAPAS